MTFKIGDYVVANEDYKAKLQKINSYLEVNNFSIDRDTIKQNRDGVFKVVKTTGLFGTYFQATLNEKQTNLKTKNYQLATIEQIRRYELGNLFAKRKDGNDVQTR